MHIVLLRFGPDRAAARQWMEAHNAWIQRGIDDGVFLLTGSLEGGAGGAVIATGLDREALDARIQDDPFVRHRVVVPEVQTILPSRIAPRLAAVLGPEQ